MAINKKDNEKALTAVEKSESMILLIIDFDLWTGQTKLRPEDIKFGVGGEVPPKDLAILGSKKIVDPGTLKEFGNIKKDLIRKIERIGLKFMGGYLVPTSQKALIKSHLDEAESRFNMVKGDFILNYEASVQQWADENKDYSKSILNSVVPVSQVATKLGFDYEFMLMAPVAGEEARFGERIEGLGDKLIEDVSQKADKFYLEYLAFKKEIAITTKKTIQGIRDRIDGLSFLNGKCAPLVAMLDEILLGYPVNAEGRYIKNAFFYQISAAMLILSDPKRIEQFLASNKTVEVVGSGLLAGSHIDQLVKAANSKIEDGEESDDFDADLDEFFADMGDEEASAAETTPVVEAVDESQSIEMVDFTDPEVVLFDEEVIDPESVQLPDIDQNSYF